MKRQGRVGVGVLRWRASHTHIDSSSDSDEEELEPEEQSDGGLPTAPPVVWSAILHSRLIDQMADGGGRGQTGKR